MLGVGLLIASLSGVPMGDLLTPRTNKPPLETRPSLGAYSGDDDDFDAESASPTSPTSPLSPRQILPRRGTERFCSRVWFESIFELSKSLTSATGDWKRGVCIKLPEIGFRICNGFAHTSCDVQNEVPPAIFWNVGARFVTTCATAPSRMPRNLCVGLCGLGDCIASS